MIDEETNKRLSAEEHRADEIRMVLEMTNDLIASNDVVKRGFEIQNDMDLGKMHRGLFSLGGLLTNRFPVMSMVLLGLCQFISERCEADPDGSWGEADREALRTLDVDDLIRKGEQALDIIKSGLIKDARRHRESQLRKVEAAGDNCEPEENCAECDKRELCPIHPAVIDAHGCFQCDPSNRCEQRGRLIAANIIKDAAWRNDWDNKYDADEDYYKQVNRCCQCSHYPQS